jgi:hypothetical protein
MATDDLNTGRTRNGRVTATVSAHVQMAQVPSPGMGSSLTPAEYRLKKVALITGAFSQVTTAAMSSLELTFSCARNHWTRWQLPHRTTAREGLRGSRTVSCTYELHSRRWLSSRVVASTHVRLVASSIRRSSSFNTGRIEHLYSNVPERESCAVMRLHVRANELTLRL